MKVERPDWSGRTVVCIASGPSLTGEDCETVKQSGHPTVVTNNTYQLAPWADVIFGMDLNWWKRHGAAVSACPGRKMSTSHAARAYGAESLWNVHWFPQALNSGQAIIGLALASGASKIVLLGYDCQKTDGKTHWHGDHEKGLGNAGSIKLWPRHFEKTSKQARADILNASRATALTCFRRVELKDEL